MYVLGRPKHLYIFAYICIHILDHSHSITVSQKINESKEIILYWSLDMK